ncbi:carbon storage regulator, CsrA [Desulfomicrobium apsheronum]|jgi:carbon storage regulator|uniref:Translational regulator CsrA n=3 Tax=Desulfomicrobium TaxID=898 RepID=A0A1I3U4J5_9BACT|nr:MULTISPECIES: carbon storage regulator CsrA [Desulfomicrobium]MDY0225568.1 carbon storage regulator CsrA [Desulfomicrobium apsheronum]SFJ77825.1 carbon storage regulator, CsrA [Desulfomicrobium apsheronum]SFL32399.1 carbon storage regulator, CsrA [Desulfomicrobium norvegicum]
MLILSRRPGESVHVGDDIKITILSIKGQQIKLGLEVPEHMPVYREEIYLKVQTQNASALELDNNDLMMAAAIWTSKDK